MGNRINHSENVARRKLHPLPDGWEICKWERMGPDATLFSGCVPGVFASGPRKGQKKWGPITRECIVTDAEADAEASRFEAETGLCHSCGGDGQEWAGWSAVEGSKFRTCRRCTGSGHVAAK